MGKKILMVLVLSVVMVFAVSPVFSQDKVYVNGIDANFPPLLLWTRMASLTVLT